MRRRQFVILAGGTVAAWPLTAHAQEKSVPVVAILGSGNMHRDTRQAVAVRNGLSEAGFEEGQNVAFEYRGANGDYDRLPALAAELVELEVDVIIAQSPPSARAAKMATSTIPVVFGVGSDPVSAGLVASLARPGGNLTGVTILATDLTEKRLALLSELVPQGRKFAILTNPKNPNALIGSLQDDAPTKGIHVEVLEAETDSQIDAAFAAMARLGIEGLVLDDDPYLFQRRKQVAALAIRHRIPAISFLRGFADAGGLISYGPSLIDAYHQIGGITARVLNGAKPADLPVKQPTKFELVINLKTAGAIGLSISPTTLARADDVVE